MVFRHGFILIAALMLLIHNDGANPWKRRKKCRPGSYDDIDFSASCPLKLITLLTLGKSGIHHGYPVTEMPVKPHQRLIGQRDFRNQHDCLPSSFYNLLNDGNIYFRFAAACNAMNQADTGDVLPLLERFKIPQHSF